MRKDPTFELTNQIVSDVTEAVANLLEWVKHSELPMLMCGSSSASQRQRPTGFYPGLR